MATFKMQVATILESNPSRSTEHHAIAQELGCSVQTALRYCQEFSTGRRRKANPPEEHHGWIDPSRQMICKLLLDAVEDVKAGKPCQKPWCDRTGHHCAEDARKFLTSTLARNLIDMLGYDSALWLSELGIEQEDS